MTAPRKTSIYATAEQVQRLAALAADCGLYQTRGPDSGRAGSLSQLLAVLADGYQEQPELVRQFIMDLRASEPLVLLAP